MGIAIANGTSTFYIPIQHTDWLDKSVKNLTVPSNFLTCIQGELVFHNAKFDIHVLKKLGLDVPTKNIYDTMLMMHMIDENRLSYDLDSIVAELLGIHKEKDLAKKMKADWDNIPAFAMAKYAEQDASVTLQLYTLLKPHFEIYEELWQKQDLPFVFLLQEMEEKGILLDKVKCRESLALAKIRKAELEKEIGFNPAKTSILRKKLFDDPPFGYGLKPIKRSAKTQVPTVNEAFLEATNHPICGLLLEWRKLQKQITSYYESYLGLTEGHDRIHASFKMHGTVTGRLSCAEPNMQQIPRESDIKKLFKAEPGKELWEIDFKNIELRLAAVYTREPVLYDTFKIEGDVHQRTADELGIDRQKAKTVNFLISYGGGATALSTQLKIPWGEADKIVKKHKASMPLLFQTMDACTEAAEYSKEIKYWTGRRRHFKWPSEYRKAFNSLIQGGSFEIVKQAMLRLQEAGFDIRNQVHDSVWIMVDSHKEVEEAEHIMADWTEELFELKFSVESKRLN